MGLGGQLQISFLSSSFDTGVLKQHDRSRKAAFTGTRCGRVSSQLQTQKVEGHLRGPAQRGQPWTGHRPQADGARGFLPEHRDNSGGVQPKPPGQN